MHESGGRWVGSNKLVELKKKKKDLRYSTGNFIQYLVITYNGNVIYIIHSVIIYITESLCCIPDPNPIL